MGDCLDESPHYAIIKGHQVILVALSLLLMAGILKTGTWTATLYARENEMKENMKIRGQLRTYLQWPIILSVFLLAANPGSWDCEPGCRSCDVGFTVIYVLVALGCSCTGETSMGGLVEFSAEYAWVQKQLLYEMAVPYAIRGHRGTFPLVEPLLFRRSSGKIKLP